MLDVVILIVIMPLGIMLSFIMLGVIYHNAKRHSVLMLWAVILIIILLRYINYADCRHAEYYNRAIHPNT